MNIDSLKNKLFLASFGLGLASTVAIFNPSHNIKSIGTFGLGVSVAGVFFGELVTGKATSQIETVKRDLDKELSEKVQQIRSLQTTVDKLLAELTTGKTVAAVLEEELQTTQSIITAKNIELVASNNAVGELRDKLRDIGRFSTGEAHQIVRKTYDRSVKKLESLLNALIRNYPYVAEELQTLYLEVDSLRLRFTRQLEEYETLESFNELLDVGLEFQERIIDRCTELKVKAQTIVIKYLSGYVEDSVPFSDYETHIQNLAAKAAEQIETLKEEHELNQKALAQEWVASNEEHVTRYDTEFAEVLNTAKYSIGRMQQMEQTIQELTNKIGELEKPIEWRSNILDAQKVGNLIIRYLWRQGARLDRAFIDNDPYEPILYFNANRLDDVVKVDEINKFSEALQQHVDLLLEPPHFSYNGQYGLLQTKIKLATKPKPTKDELVAKIPDCKSLVSKAKRGFLITGHPGAGKTSVIKAIAQWLGNENSMKLALNPHSDDMSRFDDCGFVELNHLDDIYEAIVQLDIELKLRGEDKTRRQTLIVAVDELGRILKDEPKELDVMEVLRQAAVEGRKFNVIVLIGNHSQTTTAIDMDSQFRDSFYQLFLCGAAVSRINMPNAPALKQYEEEWIRTAAYPVLIGINGRFQSCQHPTHWTYKEYQDSGNPPIGLMEMKPIVVTIGKKTYSPTIETAILTDADKELIAQNKHIVNIKTGAGLSRLIEIIKGVKASKSDEYKRVKDEISEYLKSLS
jgi:DNA polymerase III delta prime subunit